LGEHDYSDESPDSETLTEEDNEDERDEKIYKDETVDDKNEESE
jgi:hypothetical protein